MNTPLQGSSSSEPHSWQIDALLGSGAFGKVYRASGTDGRRYALKVLHSDVALTLDLEHLRTTVEGLRQVHHPVIASDNALVAHRGDTVLVTEYVEGVDLGTLSAGGGISVRAAIQVVMALAEALEAARLAPDRVGDPLRLRHGDVKPSNVILTVHGHVKLVDFGLSKLTETHAGRTLTMFHESVSFMSPERIDNLESATSDLYSLALLLCFLVTGERPRRASANPKRHEERREASIASLRTKLGTTLPALVDMVANVLSYRPEDRPSLPDFSRVCEESLDEAPGQQLSVWAATLVPAFQRTTEEIVFRDDGTRLSQAGRTPLQVMDRTLSMGAQLVAKDPPRPPRPTWPWAVAAVLAGVAAVAGVWLAG